KPRAHKAQLQTETLAAASEEAVSLTPLEQSVKEGLTRLVANDGFALLAKHFVEMQRRLYLAKNFTVLAVSHAQHANVGDDIDLWNSLEEIALMIEREADWFSNMEVQS